MRRSRNLPDEVIYYRWSVARWRSSTTREMLDATGRGVFRELLDTAYVRGSIPKDPSLLCRIAGCTREQFDSVCPTISRHFRGHAREKDQYISKHADLFRRQYFAYLEKQRKSAGAVERGLG